MQAKTIAELMHIAGRLGIGAATASTAPPDSLPDPAQNSRKPDPGIRGTNPKISYRPTRDAVTLPGDQVRSPISPWSTTRRRFAPRSDGCCVSPTTKSPPLRSGEEFLASLATHRPDCAILDVHMPGLSGFDVQARLRAAHSDVPVVFITASDDARARPEGARGRGSERCCANPSPTMRCSRQWARRFGQGVRCVMKVSPIAVRRRLN